MFQGSIVAIVTPMHRDGQLDWAAWDRLLDFHLRSGTAGIVLNGTTGESPTVLDSELRGLLGAAQARLRGRIPLIVGVGTSSTAATVERARWISALRPDALLVVTPAYNKPTQEGLYLHFQAVAAASAVPVILYNVPGRTAVDLLPPTVERLAKLPQVVALKEAVPDVGRVRELVSRCGARFHVLSGDDGTAREAILAGARGVVSVTANVAPSAMSAMVAAALQGDAERAAALDAALAPLHRDLFVEANPIPVKWCLEQMGFIEGGIRLPLTPLAARYHDLLRAALRTARVWGESRE